MRMRGITYVLLMICACLAQAQIYKWIDSQGNVHFSDQPHQGSEQVKLPPLQSISTPQQQQNNQEQQSPVNQDDTKQQPEYQSIEIVQPEDGDTVRDNQGIVNVAVVVKPQLMKGDLLQLYFDGDPLGKPQPNVSFVLNNVYRGSHTLQVKLVDAEGNDLLDSSTITFYMHRARIGMGAGGRTAN